MTKYKYEQTPAKCEYCGEMTDDPFMWTSIHFCYDLCKNCFDSFRNEHETYLKPYKKEYDEAKIRIGDIIWNKIKLKIVENGNS